MRANEALVARIRQLRRVTTADGKSSGPAVVASDQERLRALEARLDHLEQLVQGLQDSVHRESLRQDKRITELEDRIQPAALSKALSHDARERGL